MRNRWIRSSERQMNRAPAAVPPGRIAFVGTGPGDPGLLTLRARDALAAAPLLVTDADVPARRSTTPSGALRSVARDPNRTAFQTESASEAGTARRSLQRAEHPVRVDPVVGRLLALAARTAAQARQAVSTSAAAVPVRRQSSMKSDRPGMVGASACASG